MLLAVTWRVEARVFCSARINKKAVLSQRWPRDAPYNLHVYMGALKIFGSPCMATPTANFPDIFNGLLFRSIPWLCVQNLKFVPLPTPEVGLIGVVAVSKHTLQEEKVVGGRGWNRPKKRWWVHIGSNFSSIFTRCRDIATFVLLHTTSPSDSPIVSSDFPHIPLEVGRWPLCYEERRCWRNWPCN